MFEFQIAQVIATLNVTFRDTFAFIYDIRYDFCDLRV